MLAILYNIHHCIPSLLAFFVFEDIKKGWQQISKQQTVHLQAGLQQCHQQFYLYYLHEINQLCNCCNIQAIMVAMVLLSSTQMAMTILGQPIQSHLMIFHWQPCTCKLHQLTFIYLLMIKYTMPFPLVFPCYNILKNCIWGVWINPHLKRC